MNKHEMLYLIPGWVIGVVLLAASYFTVEMGFRIGRARKRAGADDEGLSTIQGGLIGFFALLLAFTFSMAANRYETRKQLVVDEANAIGTAALRAELVPAPHSARLRGLLREYIDRRLEYVAAVQDESRIASAVREAERIQSELWKAAKACSEAAPTPVTALLVEALNDVIDLSALRLHSLRDHVPEPVILFLMAVAVAAAGLVGHCMGIRGRRSLWTSVTVPSIVVVFLVLTLDLDRPRRGVITVSQQPMLDLQQQLRGS